MLGNGSSGGRGGNEPFTGRAAIGYDHGYDAQVFYLGLALDPMYMEGFVEGCLERIGEDNPEEEQPSETVWKVSKKVFSEVRIQESLVGHL